MRALIILEQGLTVDVEQYANKLKTEVTKNTFPREDGVAFFNCGQTIPTNVKWDPDFIVKVGNCEANRDLDYNMQLDSNRDWEALLAAQLEELESSDVEGGDEVEG